MENHSDRLDNILKLDANALLKTIRDLESKLSDHNRSDKPPAWALSLEARMSILEKNQTISDLGNNNHENNGTLTAPITAEEKVFQKLRTEIASKFESNQLSTDMKVSSFAFEVERLHKLLEIRPTNAEMSQIMSKAFEMERKVQESIEDLHKVIHNTVQEKLSTEMTAFMNEFKLSKAHQERGIKIVEQSVEGCQFELSDMKENVQLNLDKTNNTIHELKVDCKAIDNGLVELRSYTEEQQFNTNKVTNQVITEMKTLEKTVHDDKINIISKIANSENNMKLEMQLIRRDMSQETAKNQAIANDVLKIQGDVNKMKIIYDSDLEYLKASMDTINESIRKNDVKNKELAKLVTEIVGMDFSGKLSKHDEQITICQYDISDIKVSINTLLKVDIAGINLNLLSIRDELQKVGEEFLEQNLKIKALHDCDGQINAEIQRINEKIKSTDMKVRSLMPLQEAIVNLQDATRAADFELNGLKDTLSVLNNSVEELSRRLVDAEENIDQFEENISQRMNSVRDILMDTILEKQNETLLAMKNVKENLDVMSYAGDTGAMVPGNTNSGMFLSTNSGGNGGGSGVSSARLASTGTPPNRNRSIAFNSNDTDLGSASSGSAMFRNDQGIARRTSQNPTDLKLVQYQKPTMDGAAVVGGAAIMSRQLSVNQNGGGRPSVLKQQNMPDMSRAVSNLSLHNTTGQNNTTSLASINEDQKSAGTHIATLPGPGRNILSNSKGRRISDKSGSMSGRSLSSEQSGVSFSDSEDNVGVVAASSASSLTKTHTRKHSASAESKDREGTMIPPINESLQLESRPTTSGSREESEDRLPPVDESSKSVPINDGSSITVSVHHHHQHHGASTADQSSQNKLVLNPSDPASYDEYSQVMGGNRYPLFNEAQFMSDLCVNFEIISMKRKKVIDVPPVMCENMVAVMADCSELMAKSSDNEMVQFMIETASSTNPALLLEAKYDENFVVNRRLQKLDEFMQLVSNMVLMAHAQPGVVRLDARSMFLSLVKKGLEMFMSKHNQVLVVGNSRLGRIKIPSCIACDRPLVNKVRYDDVIANENHSQSHSNVGMTTSAWGGGVSGINPTPSIVSASLNLSLSMAGGSQVPQMTRNGNQIHDPESVVLFTSQNPNTKVLGDPLSNLRGGRGQGGGGASSKRSRQTLSLSNSAGSLVLPNLHHPY